MLNQKLSPEAEAAIERVRKLLALARDKRGNENEAANALAMAQAILERHNLDMALIERQSGDGTHKRREDQKSGGGLYKWQRQVWESVAKLNLCVYMPIKGLQKGDKYENRVIGRPENVIMTTVMAEYLQDTIERLAREWAKERYLNIFTKDAIIYREGMASTISDRLADLEYERRQEEARAAKEQAAAARHPGAAPTGNALVMVDVIQSEADLNNDYLKGWELGTTARIRAEEEAESAAYVVAYNERQAARKLRLETDPEFAAAEQKKADEAAAYWAEIAAKAVKKRGKARSRPHKERVYRETEEDRRRNNPAFWAGQRRAQDINLDLQVDADKKDMLK